MTDTSSVRVRIATRDDGPALMDVCRKLHGENGLFDMDDGMVQAMLERAFSRHGGIIGIIDGPKGIEASLYLLITSQWYTKSNHLEELWNWVHPSCRKSNHAMAMIDFAKRCSVDIGIPLIIGVITNARMAGKVRLYRRKLGYPAGALFAFNAPWKDAAKPAGEDFWREPFERRKKQNGAHPAKEG